MSRWIEEYVTDDDDWIDAVLGLWHCRWVFDDDKANCRHLIVQYVEDIDDPVYYIRAYNDYDYGKNSTCGRFTDLDKAMLAVEMLTHMNIPSEFCEES